MTLYKESVAEQTDHLPMFLFAKTLQTDMTLCRCYDVRKFTADAIFSEKFSVRKGVFYV